MACEELEWWSNEVLHYSIIPLLQYSNLYLLAYLLLRFKNETVAPTASSKLVAANL
jgi:hypothetical protein